MLPIILDMKSVRVGIAASGEGLKRKRDLVAGAGPEAPAVFDGRAPNQKELAALDILFVAGLEPTLSAEIAGKARAAGVLVNVEDQPALCDFHVPAQVRRGDLMLTVSTGGKSPAVARALREDLERRFGPEWEQHLDEIARLRDSLRAAGASPEEVSRKTRAFLDSKGWLK